MALRLGQLLGRLQSGLEHDKGTLVHAVPSGGKVIPYPNACGYRYVYPALCGTKPGPKSVGWTYGETKTVTCPRCLKKLAKGTRMKKMTVHNLMEVKALIKEHYQSGSEMDYEDTRWFTHDGEFLCQSSIFDTDFCLYLPDKSSLLVEVL